jgi:hypothetical protein
MTRRSGTAGPRSPVDVLVVGTGTTAGLRRDERTTATVARHAGLSVATAGTDYGLLGRCRWFYPLIDLIEAAGVSYALARALRRFEPRALVFVGATSALFAPADLLDRSAIRFDALVAENRSGRRSALTRWLEQRTVRSARVLAPYTQASARNVRRMETGAEVVLMPPPIAAGPEPRDPRRRAALIYAADPHKKGLDLAVAAWSQVRPPDHELLISGIDEGVGRSWLASRGLAEPEGLKWLGKISSAEHRQLSAEVAIYLGASRFDEFATTQLEALVDGALLVTVPSAGPMAPLAVARELAPELVGGAVAVDPLADALRAALAFTPEACRAYRARARIALEPLSEARFKRTLIEDLLPRLEVGTR